MILSSEYKALCGDEGKISYKKDNGDVVSFWVESDEKESDETFLYRTRFNGETRFDEYLLNGEWKFARLFTSYLLDGLLEEITLEEAEKIAEQIGESFVD